MTLPQADLQDRINKLAKANPVPAEDKMERRLARLDRMNRFYEEKAPDAPEKQGRMFKGFASALIYAATILKMYRRLTKQLAEIAEQDDQEVLH